MMIRRYETIVLAATAATCLFFGANVFFGASVAEADEAKEIHYGVIDSRRPVEIKRGLLRKKPGMAYVITIRDPKRSIEVDSANTAFLAGDCVMVSGEGDKTTLARAEQRFCKPKTTEATSSVAAHPQNHQHHGADSEACAQARAEVQSWPAGMGRRRALHRELLVCGEPSTHSVKESGTDSRACADAWTEVEGLPFGPERAAARDRARTVCESG